MGGEWLLSVQDNELAGNLWMKVGQARGDLHLLNYDTQSGEATFTYLGRVFTLGLAEASHRPMAIGSGAGNAASTQNPNFASSPRISNPLSNPQILPSSNGIKSVLKKRDGYGQSSLVQASPQNTELATSEDTPDEVTQTTSEHKRIRNYFMPRINRVNSAIKGSNKPKLMPEGL